MLWLTILPVISGHAYGYTVYSMFSVQDWMYSIIIDN